MKKLVSLVRTFLRACPRCHGMGHIETADGGTRTCPVCKGKGMIE